MATYELGKIGLNLRGAYSAGTAYKKLDVVNYNGSSYAALADNSGALPTDATKWMLLAQGTAASSAWNYPTLLAGTTPGDYGAGRMRYKKEGDRVYIAGSVNVKPGSGHVILFTLPQGFWPPAGTTATQLKPCSGSRVARIAIDSSNGNVVLEWVKNLKDGTSYTSAAIWIDCSIEFWVN